MPSKNRIKQYQANSYYHLYASSTQGRQIFVDQADYNYFLELLERYLSEAAIRDKYGRAYHNFAREVELLAFQLLPQEIQLLLFQKQQNDISRLMRRLLGAYALYFNKRYHRKGVLFEDRFRAHRIENESYLWPISCYIHLKSDIGADNPYSSYGSYVGPGGYSWVKTKRVLKLKQKGGPTTYRAYVENKKNDKQFKTEILVQLAHP